MPTSIATIAWTFVPGSVSTLVEYRVDGTLPWIQPTSPTNPTPGNSYPLEITDNTVYDVRLTTNGVACGPQGTTFTIQAVVNNCCPAGYTLSSDQSYCFQTNTTAATPPSGAENAESISGGPNGIYYSMFGTLIFDPGYSVDGTGTFTQIPYSNTFWVNGSGYPSFPSSSSTAGPLNRSSVWSPTVLNPQTVGFTVCVTVPTTSTYYVGMAADDFGQILIDGNTIVLQNKTNMETYFQANGYLYPGGADPNQITFNFWFVYPVSLTAGNHVIEILGNNTSGTVFGAAAIGCEIYNLTSAQLQAATSYASMGSGLIFSSMNYIGQPIQIGSGGVGYTCPTGYSLVLCDGPAFCTQTLTTATIACTTTTTTTTTSTTTTSTTTHTTTTTSTTTSTTSSSTTTTTTTL